MVVVNRCCMVVLACVFCWAGLGSLAWADWSACQSKPTQSCLLEEAFRGENGPLKGKERLDVLLQIDVANQVEYTTTADIEEAQRLAKDPRGLRYLYFAIRGLAAANRWEDALDEAMSATSVVHGPAFAVLTRALVKAGHQDMVLDFAKRMPPSLDRNYAIAQFAEALARVGKIDDALALIREVEGQVREINAADMLIAVAQAYASRGDTKQADQFFDKAQTALQAGLQKPPPTDDVRGIHRYEPIGLRFALISLLALRGDTAAVETALQQLPPPADDGPAANTGIEAIRMLGCRQLALALLQVKQLSLALKVAKSVPGSVIERDWVLAAIAAANAPSGGVDDARAVLASFEDTVDPKVPDPVAESRAAVVGSLALALAKAGDVPSALETTARIGDLTSRKAALLGITRTLPP